MIPNLHGLDFVRDPLLVYCKDIDFYENISFFVFTSQF